MSAGMARLQRALIFGLAAAVAMLFIGFGLAAAGAEPWLHYAAGTLCLLVAAYRTVEPDLQSSGLPRARRIGR